MRRFQWWCVPVLLVAGVVFSGASPQGQESVFQGCEPAADLQVSARIVEIDERGANARVVIEVRLASRLDLTSFRIHQSRLTVAPGGGARLGVARSTAQDLTPVALPETIDGRLSGRSESSLQTLGSASRLLLRRGDLVAAEDAALIGENAPQIILYTVTLSRGMDHHLLLDVAAEDSSGETHASQAYVRVGLDPRTKPERPEGLVQFRAARMAR